MCVQIWLVKVKCRLKEKEMPTSVHKQSTCIFLLPTSVHSCLPVKIKASASVFTARSQKKSLDRYSF